MKKLLILFVLTFFVISPSFAQTQLTTQPRGSQFASVSQVIGVTKVQLDYHRPAVKEREIWGKIVPYNAGMPWRGGANENTVISFSTDVRIEGELLKAGEYGLHFIPSESEWTVIFSSNSTSWGSFSYNPTEDALRVKVTPKSSESHWEHLTYLFKDVAPDKATCSLLWEKKEIAFKVEVNVNEEAIVSLQNQLRDKAGWTWAGWNEAARFCLNNNTHLKQGFNWATRSVFMSPNFTNMLVKAQIQAKIKEVEGDGAKELIVASLEQDLGQHQVTWKEWEKVSQYCLKNGFPDKALTNINKAEAMNPNMTVLMTKVAVLESMGDEKAAKKLKEKALARGSNAELNTYGYKLLFSGKAQEAVEVFEANAKNNPADPNVWDSLGEGYMTIGAKEKAIEALKKCLSMNPLPAVRTNSIKNLKALGVEDI